MGSAYAGHRLSRRLNVPQVFRTGRKSEPVGNGWGGRGSGRWRRKRGQGSPAPDVHLRPSDPPPDELSDGAVSATQLQGPGPRAPLRQPGPRAAPPWARTARHCLPEPMLTRALGEVEGGRQEERWAERAELARPHGSLGSRGAPAIAPSGERAQPGVGPQPPQTLTRSCPLGATVSFRAGRWSPVNVGEARAGWDQQSPTPPVQQTGPGSCCPGTRADPLRLGMG